MAKSVAVELAELRKDNEYLKSELADVKRLQYWLLGMFGAEFLAAISIVTGIIVKG